MKRTSDGGSRRVFSILGMEIEMIVQPSPEGWLARLLLLEQGLDGREPLRLGRELWRKVLLTPLSAEREALAQLFGQANRLICQVEHATVSWRSGRQGGYFGTLYVADRPRASMQVGERHDGWVALVDHMLLQRRGKVRTFPTSKAARRAALVAASRIVREGRAHLPKDL